MDQSLREHPVVGQADDDAAQQGKVVGIDTTIVVDVAPLIVLRGIVVVVHDDNTIEVLPAGRFAILLQGFTRHMQGAAPLVAQGKGSLLGDGRLGGKAIEMAHRFDAAGKDYVLLVCSLVDIYGRLWQSIANNPRVIYIPSNIHNSIFYRCADYLISMSTSESWGYSIREALHNGCAILGSKIPEIEKVVKDGENGYLLEHNLSNLDIDKIFNKIPKVKGYEEEVNPIWQKVLDGQL